MAWQTATKFLVPKTSPDDNAAIFLNTYNGLFLACGVSAGPIPPPCVWQLLDLKTIGVPANALAVDIRNFLIITNGTGSGYGDLGVSFQSPGAGWTPLQLAEQALAVGFTGVRTNGSAIVPCLNGCIEWAWLRGDNTKNEWPDQPIPSYPLGATYGINACIQGVYLP